MRIGKSPNPGKRRKTKSSMNRASAEQIESRTLLSVVPGSLDNSFGIGGSVLNWIPTSLNGELTAVDPVSGDILVAGAAYGTDAFALQRYSSSGVLRTNFGTDGTDRLNTSPASTMLSGLSVDPAGGIFVTSFDYKYSRGTAPLLVETLWKYAPDGGSDATFGSGGSVVLTSFSGFDVGFLVSAPVFLGNGDLAFPGSTTGGDSAILALTKAGKVDTAFGSNGIAAGYAGTLDAITVDSSGNLVAGGYTGALASSPSTATNAGLLERFTPSGKLDTSFGATAPGESVSIYADNYSLVYVEGGIGSIEAYGQSSAYIGDPNANTLDHFTAHGLVDGTFGDHTGDTPVDVTIISGTPLFGGNGELLIAGGRPTSVNGETTPTIVEVKADGTLDLSFGSGGYCLLPAAYGSPMQELGGISNEGSEIVYSLGTEGDNGNGFTDGFDPGRLTSSGQVDTAFGHGGVGYGLAISSTSAQRVAVTSSGQTLVAGQAMLGGNQIGIYVRRYNVNGTPDTTFASGQGLDGQSGYLIVYSADSTAVGLSVDPEGRILLGVKSLGILRYNSNGTPDFTFALSGRATLSSLDSFIVEGDGQIIATSGVDTLTKLNTNGFSIFQTTVPVTFDTEDGVTINAPLAVQADGSILVGGAAAVTKFSGPGYTTNMDLAVARVLPTGKLDTTFGTKGIASADYTGFLSPGFPGEQSPSWATALVVLSSGAIVAAGYADNGTSYGGFAGYSPVTAEFTSAGTLNTNYGTGGETAPYPVLASQGDDSVSNLIVQSNGDLVLTGTLNFPNDEDLGYVLRLTPTGAPDISFNPAAGSQGYDTYAFTAPADGDGPFDGIVAATSSANGTLTMLGYASPPGATVGPASSGFFIARIDLQATGTVAGIVFDDRNGDGILEKGEQGLAGRTVFADLNNDGVLDDGEPAAVTNSLGQYTLTAPVGQVIIRQEISAGERQSLPGAGSGAHLSVTAARLGGVNFGATTDLYISGTVTNSTTSKGMGGVLVYADLNGSGKFEPGDNSKLTNADGSFSFVSLPAGTYVFRIVPPAQYIQSSPVSKGGISVKLASGGVDTQLAFDVSPAKITGSVIGTAGSYHNLGNTIANVFDGNFNTIFDAPTATGAWVGRDLGSAIIVTQVDYAPRAGFAGRMVGGEIQASNSANFSSGVVTLFTITSTPAVGQFTTQSLKNATAYRYYRYLGPTDSFCNIAELEFDG